MEENRRDEKACIGCLKTEGEERGACHEETGIRNGGVGTSRPAQAKHSNHEIITQHRSQEDQGRDHATQERRSQARQVHFRTT